MKEKMRFRLSQVKNLNLTFKLKCLNEIMGREDPIEFYIKIYLGIIN